ncbi:MAG: ankyrin repeat domain-containing protein [Phycisphaerales bacterium JB052]
MMHKRILSGAFVATLFVGSAGAWGVNPDAQLTTQAEPTNTRATRMAPDINERIFEAAEHGDAAEMAQLLDEGADINERSRWRPTSGATPIMITLEHNPDVEVIELLIERGAKISARDGQGRSVLMYAMKRQQDQGVTEMLIKAGAKVQARDATGQSVLMYACEHANDAGVIELLLEHGARVDARDGEGRTPLMYAVRRAQDDGVISLLVEHGASIDERDAFDRDVLINAAAYARSGEVFDTLVDLGADVHARLTEESLRKNSNFHTGDTVLSFACVLNPDPEALKALVRHGADINADVAFGEFRPRQARGPFTVQTTSHLYLVAAYGQSPEVLDAALDAGATHTGEGSPLEAAKMNTNIRRSDAFWRLNDQSYD